jgi:flagellar biosynthesis/type III secretory pathway protein FliH
MPAATATSEGPAHPGATAAGFAFEQLEPSPPPPRDAHERLLARAQAQAEQIRARARAAGYDEGRAQGHADGLAEISAATGALGQALHGLEQLRDEVAQAVEHDAVELALALAAKILAGALEAQPELVVEVVRGALRRVTDRRRIVVLVDPDDLEVVNAAIGELQAQAGGIELCEVQADRRVGRGGAIVRTAEGEVDASVAVQLERAREAIAAALRDGEPAQ